MFLGKYNEEKILAEIKQLLDENEEIKGIARDLRKEVQYQKQRENKLMYFLFMLQEKEYPVYDLFEEHIKDLETERFSKDCDDRFKELFKEQETRLKELGIAADDSFVS